jgi:hypothetical protein
MKIIAGLLLVVIVFVSCKKQTAIAASLSKTDSLVIQFFSEKEVLENAATSVSKAAIDKVIELVDSREMDSIHCLKGGRVIFFSAGKEIERVSWKPSCRQFEFYFNGKTHFTAMSDEAVDFFAEIEKGEK